MTPPGRPRKKNDERYVPFSVTFPPAADEALVNIMAEDEADNRSAVLARLVLEEARRRRRRSKA